MSINSIPDKIFYAPQSWIDLAPDYDWDRLAEPVDIPGDYEPTYSNNY